MRSSSLPLLMKCSGSAVLPCLNEKSERAEQAADWGTMAHLWAQTGKIKGPGVRAERAFAKSIELSGIDREALWPVGGVFEGSLALRVDGIREASRDDSERDGWITGHYDYQHWFVDGELWVDDLKTGKFYENPMPGVPGWREDLEVGENRYPQDVRSPQIKTYALALSELLDYGGDVTVSVTHWPRLPLSKRHATPVRVWHTWRAAGLSQHWDDLEALERERKHNERALLGHEDSLILRPGDHCRFCPVIDCFVRKTFE